jgi:MFS family permease
MQTDLTTPENRQAAFSLIYLGHNLGFAIGPLVAGFLFTAAPRWIFWGNAIASTLAMALVAAFVPETKPSEAQLEASYAGDSSEKAEKGGLFKALLSRPFLLLYVFITTWFAFAYAQHRFLIPLQLESLFGQSGARLYGIMMTMNAVVVVALNIPVIALLKRFNPVLNTAIAGGLYAVGFGMLAFARDPWVFFVSAFVWTIGEVIDATNSQVYVANHTPMSHRGRFNAVLPLIWGYGWAISTPVSGRLADAYGIPATWLITGAIAAAAAVAVLLLDRAERRSKARKARLSA